MGPTEFLGRPLRRGKRRLRIGWVVGGQGGGVRAAVRRAAPIGGTALARYAWVAEHVNAKLDWGVAYEPFRWWRRCDAVVLLKSVSAQNLRLVGAKRSHGVPVIFDANVNYYESHGTEYYGGMLPTEDEKRLAVEITRRASAVIADSEFLRRACSTYNQTVAWIPDSVRLDLVPAYRPWEYRGGKLRLLWSGEAVKLFDLLAIESVLRQYASWLDLVLITNDLVALERWRPGYRERFEDLLRAVPHEIVTFRSIPHLLEVYAGGGVVISPRFLDNSYNLGHTEWKITLGMACGRMAVCSPVPSYRGVASRSGGVGIRICDEPEDWEATLEELLSGRVDQVAEEAGARAVVEHHYATDVVARAHAAFVREVVERTERDGANGR